MSLRFVMNCLTTSLPPPAAGFLHAAFRLSAAAALAAGILAGAPSLSAAGLPQKAPDATDRSRKVWEWKSAEGVTYLWRGPRKYDPAKGAGLTFILHGSNLTRMWGFANHSKDNFRPDDVVVCPDGTTANGSGGYNFMDAPADVAKFHALTAEVKKAFNVQGTFLYGHSQGSFFALKYAGEHAAEVNGVVAHASGLWTSSRTGPEAHHQAIVFMHGTLDPVVPYRQSVDGYEALKTAGYPAVRLRSLEGWNHWPAAQNGPVDHTSQQLAWVEGMTTKDPVRLAACFETLAFAKKKDEHDWAGLYTLAKRVTASDIAPAQIKSKAQKATGIVETLAKAHTAVLAVKGPTVAFEPKPWAAHLPMFFRAFPDVPARDELYERWKDPLTAQQLEAAAPLKAWQEAMSGADKATAFEKGVALLTAGFLTRLNADGTLAANLAAWEKDARKLKIGRESLKSYTDIMDALKQGRQAFLGLNAKANSP